MLPLLGDAVLHRQGHNLGEKDIVDPLVQEVLDEAVGQLPGIAEGGAPSLLSPGLGAVRQHHLRTDLAEEGVKQGVERIGEVGLGNADPLHPAPVRLPRPVLAIVHQGLPLPHQVELPGVSLDAVLLVVEAVAGAPEGDLLAVHDGHRDLAPTVALLPAPLADKGLAVLDLPFRQLEEIEAPPFGQPVLDAVLDLQGHPESAHQPRVRGNHDLPVDEGGHGEGHRLVVTDAPLHEDLLPHGALPLDPVHVVHADRVDQPRDDVLLFDPFVGGGLDVGADERGALIVEVGGAASREGDGLDPLVVDAETLVRRLLQKRAGARRARLVHGVVRGHPVGEMGVLGVLPADLEDGVHLRVEVGRAGGVGDDLVDGLGGPAVQGRDVPPRARHPQTDNVYL